MSVQSGRSLAFHPLRALAAGEPVTIAYTNANAPLAARRKVLAQDYFFECRCVRCEREASPAPGAAAKISYPQKHVHIKKGPPKKKILAAKGHTYEAAFAGMSLGG